MKDIKRNLAVAMATIIAVGSVQSLPLVWAKTSEKEIVDFQELSEETLYQEVEYGTKKRSLDLPDYLYAEIADDSEDDFFFSDEDDILSATPANASYNVDDEDDWEKVRVNWILGASNDQDEYDGKVPGFYVFEAELVNDNYKLNGAELPSIEIEVLEETENIKETDSCVAKVGDKEYKTIAEAVDSISGSAKTTIVMMSDSEETEQIVISGSKQIVLDLNGYTLTGPDDAIVVKGKKASWTLKDSSEEKEGSIIGGVSMKDGGKFIMEGGSVKR